MATEKQITLNASISSSSPAYDSRGPSIKESKKGVGFEP